MEAGDQGSEVGLPAEASAEAGGQRSDDGTRRSRLRPAALAKTGAVAAAVLAIIVVGRSGCGREFMPPIRQHGTWLVVENQTKSPWKDVTVTLNAYYRGASPALAAGARLEAPLANFVTGLGQRFNTAREHIRRVEVRATDAAGNPVVLDWDEKTGPPLVQEGQNR
jgi:hypothetical protein